MSHFHHICSFNSDFKEQTKLYKKMWQIKVLKQSFDWQLEFLKSTRYKTNTSTKITCVIQYSTLTKVMAAIFCGWMLWNLGMISCKPSTVIYMIKCPCGLAYVGKTSRSLKSTISEHRCHIRNHQSGLAANLFNHMNPSLSCLCCIGTEHAHFQKVYFQVLQCNITLIFSLYFLWIHVF